MIISFGLVWFCCSVSFSIITVFFVSEFELKRKTFQITTSSYEFSTGYGPRFSPGDFFAAG